MWKQSRVGSATIVFVVFAFAVTVGRSEGITVRFDQEVYQVSGPGETVVAQVLIDGDSSREGLQPISAGLFSAGITMMFDGEKAEIGTVADVTIQRELNYFGFSAPALIELTSTGEVSLHGNVSQSNSPPVAYQGAPLAKVVLTNRASAIDSYPLELDFSRDLGPNEDFFVDGSGVTRDTQIIFLPSRVVVTGADEPGDFDGDGVLDVQDLDLLADAVGVGGQAATFDLNDDSRVDFEDLRLFVEGPTFLNSWIGDANLDGEFSSGDFVTVFVAGLYERGLPATWSQGDWNADGFFDSGDFVSAFVSGGYESGKRADALAVPEPSSVLLLAIGALLFWHRR
ncbi:MAG: PEP-CTERM sorting domain-containing protein [Planctomycetaceae bacterium]|nr:PEP-CTERM sorting domain-containing protein [Planctomycetaceae bacterium]